MEQATPSYHFKSYTELFQTKPENPSFYTRIIITFKHALPDFKTFDTLLVCKAHRADPWTGTALYKNIFFIVIIPDNGDNICLHMFI